MGIDERGLKTTKPLMICLSVCESKEALFRIQKRLLCCDQLLVNACGLAAKQSPTMHLTTKTYKKIPAVELCVLASAILVCLSVIT